MELVDFPIASIPSETSSLPVKGEAGSFAERGFYGDFPLYLPQFFGRDLQNPFSERQGTMQRHIVEWRLVVAIIRSQIDDPWAWRPWRLGLPKDD